MTISRVLTGFFMGVILLVPGASVHAALTPQQVQSVVSLLASFGADSPTISRVQTALSGGSYYGGSGASCPQLYSNLTFGMTDAQTGGQVSALQRYFGLTPTGYYGALTRQTVSNFQSQRGLYPVTGGVGPLTRAEIVRTCGGGGVVGGNTFMLGGPFIAYPGQVTTESTMGQLTVEVKSIQNAAIPSVDVQFTQQCARGTQCFYAPQQRVTMLPGQTTTFDRYSIALLNVQYGYATFSASYAGSPIGGAPTISSITPTSGPVGTQVTIYGTNFTQDNTVQFGTGGAVRVPSYNNGTMIYFTIPSVVGPCSYVGDTSPIRCLAAAQEVTPGNYVISVSNTYGQTGQISFSVSNSQANTFSLTNPTNGAFYTRNQDILVSWRTSNTIPSFANVVLDLYDVSNSKIGTFAVPNIAAGSYAWRIPTYDPGLFCTLQYPGICGSSIPPGHYYIKATVSSNGLDPYATQYGSATSGVFTIQ